jgi:hypothetical protein
MTDQKTRFNYQTERLNRLETIINSLYASEKMKELARNEKLELLKEINEALEKSIKKGTDNE